MIAFDAFDERIVLLLNSKVLLVVNRTNVAQRMQVRIGYLNGIVLDKNTKVVCGIAGAGALLVHFFAGENLMSVEVPQSLWTDSEIEVEEEEGSKIQRPLANAVD
jgi:hypothetical protein